MFWCFDVFQYFYVHGRNNPGLKRTYQDRNDPLPKLAETTETETTWPKQPGAETTWNLFARYWLRPINTWTGNYSAKYLFYRYDDVVAMILPVTGFRLECAKINRVESDK